MFLRLFSLLIFIVSGSLANQCPPGSGQSYLPPTHSGEQCIFPFTYEGKVYHDCMEEVWHQEGAISIPQLECPVNSCYGDGEEVRWATCITTKKSASKKRWEKDETTNNCHLHSNSSSGFCDCDFRDSFCHWRESKSSSARFIRRSTVGLIPSHDTPASSAEHFVAMVDSESLRFYRPVQLESPLFPVATESLCRLELMYRRFGAASQSSPCVSVLVKSDNSSESTPVFRDCFVSSSRWQLVSAPIGAQGSDKRAVVSVEPPTYVANAVRDVASLLVSKLVFRACTREDRPPPLAKLYLRGGIFP